MNIETRRRASAAALLVLSWLLVGGVAGAAPKGASEPHVTVEVAVAPAEVKAGGEAEITVKVAPLPGIKLNKYPRIKVSIPEVPGLVANAEGSVGDDAPPPPDKMEGNYFKTPEPLKLKVKLDAAAPKGARKLDAKLSYFYCVSASGYCAPAKEPLQIPVTIR